MTELPDLTSKKTDTAAVRKFSFADFKQHSHKSVRLCYGWSYYQYKKKYDAMLLDPEVKKEFGDYNYPFTPKQIEIMIEEWGYPGEE